MQRTAKAFMNNRSEQEDEVVLSAHPEDWSSYLADGPVASAEFMEGIEDFTSESREEWDTTP